MNIENTLKIVKIENTLNTLNNINTKTHKSVVSTMATQRVKSKNLFNFRPAGVVDADILAYEEKLQADMGGSEMEMMKTFNSLPDGEYVAEMRKMCDDLMEGDSYFNHPLLHQVRYYQ